MKRFITTILVVALTAVAAIAQTAPATATDVKLFGFEAGVSVGFNLNGNTTAGGTCFGLNLVVADNVTVGFQTSTIGAGFNTLKLSYFLNQSLGFSTNLGVSAGSPAAGLGVFFNLGKSTSANGLASSYKVKLDYLFQTANLATGVLAVTAAMNLGL